MIVRALAEQDHAPWLALWNGYNAFYGRSGATALPRDVTAKTWSRLLDPDERMHGIVAELGGEVAGIAHYLFHRSTTAIDDVCYLQDLFVAPELRGRGLAEALILAVRDRAREHGAAKLYWQTHETNDTARRVYDRVAERSGFIVYRMPLR